MKFPSLKITNFLTITGAEISLADRGLTLIQGINNDDTSADSNGAGKSSIADAVCWCLYGTTARGVSGDDVVNETAGKGTVVELTIEDNTDTYVVARHRKHKTGKNSLKVTKIEQTIGGATNLLDLTKGTDKLTQEVVDKILGASLDVFKASICAGQEQMPDLPAMTDKSLKVLLEEASGTMILDQAYEEARQRVLNAKTAYAQAESHHNALAASKAAQEIHRTNAINFKAQWENARQQRITTDKATLGQMIAAINVQKTALAAGSTTTQVIEQEISDLQSKIAAVNTERQTLAALENDVALAKSALDKAEASLTYNQGLLERAEAGKDLIDHKIGCPCTECGRPLTAQELTAATEAVDKRISDAKDQVQAANKAVADAKPPYAAAVKKRNDYAATMTDVSAASVELSQKTKELHDLRAAEAELKHKIEQAQSFGEGIKAMAAEPNPHEAAIAGLDAAITKLTADIGFAADALKKAQTEIDLAGAVVQVFAPAGVRAVVLDEVTPFLNQQTSKYLSTLSDGNINATWTTLTPNGKGELKEKFTIDVENAKGAKSFAGLSGGEKRKVRIATALALQDLVATRAVKPIDLFIGDEIDDALDPAGLERLTQILDEKAQERGTVLVISHNELTDWISNIIQIEKQPGGATKVTEMTV